MLIGHSTGGFIVQKYLAERDAPAGVLVASTPTRGIGFSAVRVWVRHPWQVMRANISGGARDIFNTPALARDFFFSPQTPQQIVDACAARVEHDSMRAVFLDQTLRLPRPNRVRTPLLVLGGAEDGLISQKEVRATARAYGADVELFTGMGHMLMLEPGWADVAQRICGWLGARGL